MKQPEIFNRRLEDLSFIYFSFGYHSVQLGMCQGVLTMGEKFDKEQRMHLRSLHLKEGTELEARDGASCASSERWVL